MSELDIAPHVVAMRPRSRWRGLRFLIVAILILACAAVAYHYYAAFVADKRLDEAIANADRLDPGWRIPEIEARREKIPDEQNAMLLVMPARQLQPVPRSAISIHDEIQALPPQEQLSKQQLKAMSAELQRAAKVIENARSIADMPRGRYDEVLAADVISTALTQYDALGTLHFYLLFDVAKRAQENDAEGAFRSAQAMFNSARALGDDHFLTVQMGRSVRGRQALHAAERVLAQGQVSEMTLESLQRLVEEEEAYPAFLTAARGERAVMDLLMERLQRGEVKLGPVRRLLASFGNRKLRHTGLERVDNFLLALPDSSIKMARAAFLDYTTECVEIAKLPIEQQDEAMKRLEAKHEDLPILAREFATLGFLTKVAEQFRQSRAELRCAAALLAAERYRLKKGRFPISLGELVPAYLKKVPTDPYDGAPIRYRKLKHGYVIYALGPDGEDNGGNIVRTYPLPKGVDVGFRLWDVSQRRQPSEADNADLPAVERK
jgi:hypothetical protein